MGPRMSRSSITIADGDWPVPPRVFGPIHPGTMLREEFIGPMGISAYRLAKDIGVPLSRVTAILDGRRAVSADTALRLGHYFDMTADFWLNLQNKYDLEVAREAIGDRLEREVRPLPRQAAE